MKCLQSAVRLSSKGSVTPQVWFLCLHPHRALPARCARLVWAMLCPPCASVSLAGRSGERGWRLLHVFIPELRAGLIFLLRRQCVTRGSGEMGWEELASWVPADCAALNSPSQLLCRLSGVACKPTCFSEGGNLVGAVPWQQETASFCPPLPRG